MREYQHSVFLELFSILSFFISCTDDPDLSVGEKLALTVTDHFIIVPNYWCSVHQGAWIYISVWRKLFLNGSMLHCRPTHSTIFCLTFNLYSWSYNLTYCLQGLSSSHQEPHLILISSKCKICFLSAVSSYLLFAFIYLMMQ